VVALIDVAAPLGSSHRAASFRWLILRNVRNPRFV
jgi:hypothetical protein